MTYVNSKAFKGQGTLLQRGDAGSPENFTTIAEMQQVQVSGKKADLADVTNMDSISAYREFLPTLLDAGEISFTGNYIPHDSTQQSLQSDFDGQTLHNWKIVLPAKSITGVSDTKPGYWSFAAYVTGLDIDLSHDKEAKITGKLKVTGKPTFTDETT